MIKIIDGNLLNAETDIIAHQVNCQGAFNSGVAKAIREYNYFIYEDYKSFVDYFYKLGIKDQLLGNTRIFFDSKSNKFFASLFAQDSYGYDGKQYTDIEAFRSCLIELKKTFGSCTRNNDGSYQPTSIAFPYKIGCVRGGADWDVIYNIIEEELADAGYNVEFWRLDLG